MVGHAFVTRVQVVALMGEAMKVSMQLPEWAYAGATRKLSDAWGAADPRAIGSAVRLAEWCATDIRKSGHTVRRAGT